ncbi:MAG: serine protease [Verrucomicrobiota bacterium]
MKRMIGAVLFTLMLQGAFSQGISTVTIDGRQYNDIESVRLGAGGKIYFDYGGGSLGVGSADKFPDAFLKSWKITPQQQEAAKVTEAKKSADDLERAISSGSFRELDGIVYDTRKRASGWTFIRNARVLQVTDAGAILLMPVSGGEDVAIFVTGMSSTISDTDVLSFAARSTGNYSYINKLQNDRTIRAYDVGRLCLRSEIPDAVLSGQKPFDFAINGKEQRVNVLATLPENDELKATGSGFFITEDGYFITNFHVVEDARKIKIRNSDGIFPAVVIRRDKVNDLALLKVTGKFNPLSVAKEDAQLGESVFTIGFPNIQMQGTQPKYTDGKVSSLAGLKDDPKQYQISVPVQPGNSGGPLVNSEGAVAGVIVAQIGDFAALRHTGSLPQNVNYAIKARLLREFLATTPEVMLSKSLLQTNAVKAAEKSVALVMTY